LIRRRTRRSLTEQLVALADELIRTRDGQLVFGRAVPAAEAEHWTEAQYRSAALETFRALAPLYRLPLGAGQPDDGRW